MQVETLIVLILRCLFQDIVAVKTLLFIHFSVKLWKSRISHSCVKSCSIFQLLDFFLAGRSGTLQVQSHPRPFLGSRAGEAPQPGRAAGGWHWWHCLGPCPLQDISWVLPGAVQSFQGIPEEGRASARLHWALCAKALSNLCLPSLQDTSASQTGLRGGRTRRGCFSAQREDLSLSQSTTQLGKSCHDKIWV